MENRGSIFFLYGCDLEIVHGNTIHISLAGTQSQDPASL